VDRAAEVCICGELHSFLFHFGVLHSFTDGFAYSHFRSLDWFCILPSPFLTTDLWDDREFVSSSLTVVRSLVTSRVSLSLIEPREAVPHFQHSRLSAECPCRGMRYWSPRLLQLRMICGSTTLGLTPAMMGSMKRNWHREGRSTRAEE
jgi:hypothetical protein